MTAGTAWIGTSGWNYRHWIGPFYPEGTKPKDFLEEYLKHFRTTELNTTFYRLPKERSVERWREAAPEGFRYAVKASRYITHVKKLLNPEVTLPKMLDVAATLGEACGPLLFQLPPNLKPHPERLEALLDELPDGYRAVFEFRNPDWLNDEVYDILRRAGAALCLYEFEGRQTENVVTADFVYIRLHGPGERYRGSYDEAALRGWAETISAWTGEGRDVFCYFDNDEKGYAPQNALQLKAILGA